MRYRVDELAARAGVSVDTVRYYQTRGVLPPPERSGRIALYGDAHLERLERIKELKGRGFTLGSIAALFAGDLDPADRALVDAVASVAPGGPESLFTLDELARRTGVSAALLEAVAREGLMVPRVVDGRAMYTEADVGAVAAGMALLEAGLPLSELLALARDHHEAMRAVAARAVDLFVTFVRDPIRAAAADDAEAAREMVQAFHQMLPATRALVTHHFERLLLGEALARIEQEGSEREVAAVREGTAGSLEGVWPA